MNLSVNSLSSMFHQIPSVFGDAQRYRSRDFILSATRLYLSRLDQHSKSDEDKQSRADPSYFTQSNTIPLLAAKVALPDPAGVVDLLEMLPPHIADEYRLPLPELFATCPTKVELNRPLTMCSRSEYISLIHRMRAANMLTFTQTPKVVNGLFGVKKDADWTRLIINCQPANAEFYEPPHVSLPTPDCLSRLVCDAVARLFVAKVDLSNYYHQLRVPAWMHPYFALPAVDSSELGLDSEFGSNVTVYPCCTTLPMGWSHSVYLAQAAHEHLLYTETSLRRADAILNTTDAVIDRLRHLIYIDDFVLIGLDHDSCLAAQDEYLAACKRRGLPVKMSKVVPPTDGPIEIIGVELNNSVLGVRPAKLDSLIADTRRLLGRRFATGLQVSALLGRWTWAMLCRRPCLSVFSSVYRFTQCAKAKPFRIWPSVRRELATACGLAPLLYSNLTVGYFDRIIASDASTTGQGVAAASLPHRVARELVARPPVNSASAFPHLPSSCEHDDVPRASLPRALLKGPQPAAPPPPTVNKYEFLASPHWRKIISSQWVSPPEHNVASCVHSRPHFAGA